MLENGETSAMFSQLYPNLNLPNNETLFTVVYHKLTLICPNPCQPPWHVLVSLST